MLSMLLQVCNACTQLCTGSDADDKEKKNRKRKKERRKIYPGTGHGINGGDTRLIACNANDMVVDDHVQMERSNSNSG